MEMKTKRKREQHCSFCKNHHIIVAKKGHKRFCKRISCTCARCDLTRLRQKVMAKQVKLRRDQEQDEALGIIRRTEQLNIAESDFRPNEHSSSLPPPPPLTSLLSPRSQVGLQHSPPPGPEETAGGFQTVRPQAAHETRNSVESPPSPDPSSTRPKCSRCKNHGHNIALKGHQALCPYRNCVCEKCILLSERHLILAAQSKLQKEKPRDEQPRRSEPTYKDNIPDDEPIPLLNNPRNPSYLNDHTRRSSPPTAMPLPPAAQSSPPPVPPVRLTIEHYRRQIQQMLINLASHLPTVEIATLLYGMLKQNNFNIEMTYDKLSEATQEMCTLGLLEASSSPPPSSSYVGGHASAVWNPHFSTSASSLSHCSTLRCVAPSYFGPPYIHSLSTQAPYSSTASSSTDQRVRVTSPQL